MSRFEVSGWAIEVYIDGMFEYYEHEIHEHQIEFYTMKAVADSYAAYLNGVPRDTSTWDYKVVPVRITIQSFDKGG